MIWLGGETEYSLADLPSKHALGSTHFREAQKFRNLIDPTRRDGI